MDVFKRRNKPKRVAWRSHYTNRCRSCCQSPVNGVPINSQRSSDFDFLSKIGSGGFANVYRVVNKLDDRNYAIKEIPMRKIEISKKICGEVDYLSCLNHVNVVRYYGSWIGRSSVTETDLSDEENSDFESIARSHTSPDSYVTFKESGDESVQEQTRDASPKTIAYSIYIQMELCTNSTLRNAMATTFWFKDDQRRNRLFREIVEGLVHIHERNIIHRDLKPSNIFLDSHDRVKIGDFGLATKADFDLSDELSRSSSLTCSIGTPFYIAPEVKSPSLGELKVPYDHKVDIYSLGVIFFEMYYHLKTRAERVQVLNDLRIPEIKLPADADQYLSPERISLVMCLLCHDITKRPTANELRENAYFQSSQPAKDESPAGTKNVKGKPASMLAYNLRSYQYVTTKLTKIFQDEGAIRLFVPISFLSSSDRLISLPEIVNVKSSPYDLRVLFARYIAGNNFYNFNRYSIETIFLPQKISKVPRRIDECAFDIVTSKENLENFPGPLLEILSLTHKILYEFDCLKGKAFVLCLNHVKILRGLLTYCGVAEDKHPTVLKIIAELNEKRRGYKFRRQSTLNHKGASIAFVVKSLLLARFREQKISINRNDFEKLLKISELEIESIQDLKRYFIDNLATKKSHHSKGIEMINQAICEMESIVNPFIACDKNLSIQVKFVPMIMNRNYSGTLFQLESTHGKSRKNVFAIGGHYDELINQFKVQTDPNKSDLIAVGLSFDAWQLTRLLNRKNRY